MTRPPPARLFALLVTVAPPADAGAAPEAAARSATPGALADRTGPDVARGAPPDARGARAGSGRIDLALARLRPAGPPLVFHGNVVLTDEVYLALLDLPPDFAADHAGAASVRARIFDFLHRAGYELARVETAVDHGRIRVDIDEGHIERLVLTGQSSIRTIQLLLTLSLPMNVFNRPYLERQLAAVRAATGIEVESFDLVPTTDVEHVGPQIEGLPLVDELSHFLGHPLIPPRSPYELHIAFKHREWSTGWGLDAALDGVNGFALGTSYRGSDLVLARDRWMTEARLGLKLRSRVSDGNAYGALQDARLQAGWYTPPLVSDLRPMIRLRGELTSRQRPDVGVESYDFTRLGAAVALSYELFPGAEISVGTGGEQRDVFALRAVGGRTPPPTVGSSSDLLPFFGVDASLVFDADDIRTDRQHRLEIENHHYPGGARGFGVTTLDYRKVFPFGWHDLWLRAGGGWLWGDVPFVEERQVGGSYVRGVFDGRFYARHVASASLEGRFSLTRDVYKVGAFADFAFFGDIDRTSGDETPRGIASVGPSFHVLVADAFQLDLYYAIGFASIHEVQRGFAASFQQAF